MRSVYWLAYRIPRPSRFAWISDGLPSPWGRYIHAPHSWMRLRTDVIPASDAPGPIGLLPGGPLFDC